MHDCNRMSAAITGAPASYNAGLSLFCRANGDGFAFGLTSTSTYTFQNNTFLGYGTVSYDIECGGSGGDCSGAQLIFENNIDIGFPNPLNGGTAPALFYGGPGVAAQPFTTRDHNIAYGFHDITCPTSFTAETCASPLLVSQPTFTSEASLDAVDFHLSAGSPAVDSGVAIPAVSDDHDGNPRPHGAGYDIGATEL